MKAKTHLSPVLIPGHLQDWSGSDKIVSGNNGRLDFSEYLTCYLLVPDSLLPEIPGQAVQEINVGVTGILCQHEYMAGAAQRVSTSQMK